MRVPLPQTSTTFDVQYLLLTSFKRRLINTTNIAWFHSCASFVIFAVVRSHTYLRSHGGRALLNRRRRRRGRRRRRCRCRCWCRCWCRCRCRHRRRRRSGRCSLYPAALHLGRPFHLLSRSPNSCTATWDKKLKLHQQQKNTNNNDARRLHLVARFSRRNKLSRGSSLSPRFPTPATLATRLCPRGNTPTAVSYIHMLGRDTRRGVFVTDV